MIELVTLAEVRLARNRKSVFVTAQLPQQMATVGEVAPILRGAASLKDEKVDGAWRRLILDFRSNPAILNFVNGAELARYSQAGVVTPDHTIRTKNWPLIVPAPARRHGSPTSSATRRRPWPPSSTTTRPISRATTRASAAARRCSIRCRASCWCRGSACSGSAARKKDARIAADLAEAAIETITDAEAIGRFESISEADMFDMEYWSLEQAKLGTAKELPLTGQIAVDHRRGRRDRRRDRAGRLPAPAPRWRCSTSTKRRRAHRRRRSAAAALALNCDVTSAASVRAAFDKVVEAFGGVDIVVSNAGAAWQGRIGEVDEEMLRKSFELNFYGHQRVAQAAVKIMLAQGTGGCLLFNVSKQAVNPGPNFGPYGLPKAATLFLVRQYALDYGAEGIRANAVNADRIRSGLLTNDFIAERARARGVSEKDYMSGNLLGREVTPRTSRRRSWRRRWRSRPPPTSPRSTAAISRRRCGSGRDCPPR